MMRLCNTVCTEYHDAAPKLEAGLIKTLYKPTMKCRILPVQHVPAMFILIQKHYAHSNNGNHRARLS
jgi:hypothetical protein